MFSSDFYDFRMRGFLGVFLGGRVSGVFASVYLRQSKTSFVAVKPPTYLPAILLFL